MVSASFITKRVHHLIKPPRRDFRFTYIHGITWDQVAGSPDFAKSWAAFKPLLEGADFIAAHNASFDRRVLDACCDAAGIERLPKPFICTVKLARKIWNIRPTKLPNVCEHLGIQLDHHQALSDAEACAKIVIAALKSGADIGVEQAGSMAG